MTHGLLTPNPTVNVGKAQAKPCSVGDTTRDAINSGEANELVEFRSAIPRYGPASRQASRPPD